MNIFLWVLQVLLALHTLMGALWKFSNTAEQAVPSLAALGPSVWMALAIIEICFAIDLVIPLVVKKLALLAPIAAIGIAVEMLIFCGIHFSSGQGDMGQPIYWLVVAAICGFVAFGRLKVKPIQAV